MALLKYNGTGTGSKNTSGQGAGGSATIDMEQLAIRFLPAEREEGEESAYRVVNDTSFVKQVRLVTDAGDEVATVSIDEQGRFYFDRAIICREDVVSYGVQSTDVQTIDEYIAEQFEANPTGVSQAVMTKIRIGDKIYTIEGSGGGGGGMIWGGTTGDGNVVSALVYDDETKSLSAQRNVTAITQHQDISGKADKNMTMMRRGYIASGDLDSYRDEAGTYGCDLSQVSNKPDGAYNWGDLIVTGWNNYTSAQIYIPDNGSGMYVRTYWNGGWRAWNQVALTKQLSSYLPLAGGTMSGSLTFSHSGSAGTSNLKLCFAPTEVWNDGAYDHPQYGLDYSHFNTGVYSMALSSYFGMCFHTYKGLLTLTGGGNFGVGKASPTCKLDVDGDCRSTYMYFLNRAKTANAGWVGRGSSLHDDITLYSENNLNLRSDGGTIYFSFKGTNKSSLDSDGNFITSGDTAAFSDARLKTDIKPLEYRGPIEPKEYVKDGKKCIGFIAQEVREKYPELVLGEETEDSYLSLNYGAITAVLAAENKELRARLDKLEDMLNKLMKGRV